MKSFKIWSTFVNGYRKAKNCSLREAMMDCGKNGGVYKKWQSKSGNLRTESEIKESINDFFKTGFPACFKLF